MASEEPCFGHDQEIDQCLQEADEIRRSILSSSGSNDLEQGHEELDNVMVRLEDNFSNILFSLPSISGDDDSSTDSSFSSGRTSFRISTSEAYCTSPPMGQGNNMAADHEILHYSQIGFSRTITVTRPPEAIYYLQRIAEQMISSGYRQGCVQAYSFARKAAVDASFRKLGLEKLTIRDIQMLESGSLDNIVCKWTASVQEIFASEKWLFQEIFEGSSLSTATRYTCFSETVKEPAKQLLRFAQAVSSSRRFAEKLFSILDLHKALSDLFPEIETTFKHGRWESIAVEAAETLSKLVDATKVILVDFENSLLHEISTAPITGGGIHPMARYVINYVELMLNFKQTLQELIVSKPPSLELIMASDLIKDFMQLEGKTNLGLHFNWITTVLQFKLEEKSKQYKDPSLAHLFMMNNVNYIVLKIKGSPELREMIGDDYLRILIGKLHIAAISYQRSTWARVLHCLRNEGVYVNSGLSFGVSMSELRKRFKTFNAMFKEVHRTQATWLVPDSQLREELCISISEKLIPAYRSFLRRFRSHIESGRHPENYVKYSVEDLEVAVLDFFEQHNRS